MTCGPRATVWGTDGLGMKLHTFDGQVRMPQPHATAYPIEAAKSLSEIIKNHQSAVVRVDHMIAIKLTRNGKVRTLITVLPPAAQEAMKSDPTVIEAGTTTQIDRQRIRRHAYATGRF